MKVVTFTGKGGTTKTTSVVNIAVAALHEGLRVVILDTDPEKSASLWRSCRGTDDIPVVRCKADDAGAVVEKARQKGFDLVLIDTPGALTRATELTMGLADFICITTLPGIFDLDRTLPRVDIAKCLGIDYAVVISKADPKRENVDSLLVADLRAALATHGANRWHRQITKRTDIPKALAVGMGVLEFAPNSLATAEYLSLWAAITYRLERTANASGEEKHHAH